MTDISNKALALLLVAAIVVSIGGTYVSLGKLGAMRGITGRATDTDSGTATLNVNSNVTITFTVSSVDWGTGYINNTNTGGMDYCIMDSNGVKTSSCINFTTVSTPFTIRNDGNVNVSLQLRSDKTPAQFLGGTNPGFSWRLATAASGYDGCPSANRNATMASYTTVSTTDIYACGSDSGRYFNYLDGSDEIDLHVNVSLPEDATTGSHIATLTATGTSA